MFDIGFSELVVIAVVALVVLGPERLPRVARTMGHLFGRMQRYVAEVKQSIDREMQSDELRKIHGDIKEQVAAINHAVHDEVAQVQDQLVIVEESVKESLAPPAESIVAGPIVAEPVPPPAEPSPQLELGLEPVNAPGQHKPS